MKQHPVPFLLSFAVALFLCGSAQAQPAPAPQNAETVATLRSRVQGTLQHARFSQARWGVKVIAVDTGKIIYEHNADTLMTPASNAKMFTCALALDRLGPEFKIKTSCHAQSKPDTNGIVRGSLVVCGRGDPTLSARFNGGDHARAIQPLVASLVAAGIKRIEGDLVGDESFFRSPPLGAGWAWDDFQWAFAAPVSALSLDDNALGFSVRPGKQAGDPCQIIARTNFVTFQNRARTTAKNVAPSLAIYHPPGENTIYVTGGLPVGGSYGDSVSVQNPALWFVAQLKDALAQNGITVTGRARAVNWLDAEPIDYDKLVEVASIQSHPIKAIVKETMKSSQNLCAQLLLLQVGASCRGPGKPASAEQAALAEMRKFAKEAGIKPGTLFLKEGSGLSPACQVAPGAAVALLSYMTHHRYASAFMDALPIAGIDGTLKNRFGGTAAQNHVWAKTGTMEYISTISGYLVTQGNERWIFSVMLNGFKDPGGIYSAREETDAIVQLLAEFNGKS